MGWRETLWNELPIFLSLIETAEPLPVVETDGVGGLAWQHHLGWVVEVPSHLPAKDKIAFYMHCLAHYILRHHERRPQSLLQDTWDAAADYVANAFLRQVLLDAPSFLRTNAPTIYECVQRTSPYNPDWRKLSVEDIYFRLLTTGRKHRAGDSHNMFGSDGYVALPQGWGKGVGDEIIGGNIAGNLVYSCEILPAKIPLQLERYITRSAYRFVDDLDLLSLSYGRVEFIWTGRMQAAAIHIVDVSGSMWQHLSKNFSAALSVISYLHEVFMDGCLQWVIIADAVKQGMWCGHEPDATLLRKFKRGFGGGGTQIFKSSLDDILRYASHFPLHLFVYSDLFLNSEDMGYLLFLLRQAKRALTTKIAILPPRSNSELLPYFDLHLQFKDFGL